MDPAILIYIFMGIDFVLYAIISGYIFYRVKKTKITSLIHLAITLLLVMICFILYIALGKASTIYHVFRTSAMVWFFIFTKQIFYQDQKSATPIFLLYGVLTVIGVALTFELNDKDRVAGSLASSDLFFGIFLMISSLWHFYSARLAYEEIKNQNVAPFIKKRYVLLEYGAIALSISGLFSAIVGFTYQDEWTVIFFISISLANMIFLIMNYLVWIMPAKLKTILNGDWKATTDEIELDDNLSEEEIMKKLMEDT